jgi:hypothetical protein
VDRRETRNCQLGEQVTSETVITHISAICTGEFSQQKCDSLLYLHLRAPWDFGARIRSPPPPFYLPPQLLWTPRTGHSFGESSTSLKYGLSVSDVM